MKEIGVKDLPDYSLVTEWVKFGNVYPLDGACIISSRFAFVHRNRNGIIHKDGGPAAGYADGIQIYALNGVTVPAWLAETPHHKLDAAKFLEIEDVEVRREFIRKLGIERITQNTSLAQLIDKKGDYELYLVDLKGTTSKVPCLKMLNPSLDGVWHMEFVKKGIKTVDEALEFRNKSKEAPLVLT
jgi:hypothetical protein